MTIKKKTFFSVCKTAAYGLVSLDMHKARLSNVTGQILTDPQRQVFRETIANAVRLRGGIYIKNVRRTLKHRRQAVQCCQP